MNPGLDAAGLRAFERALGAPLPDGAREAREAIHEAIREEDREDREARREEARREVALAEQLACAAAFGRNHLVAYGSAGGDAILGARPQVGPIPVRELRKTPDHLRAAIAFTSRHVVPRDPSERRAQARRVVQARGAVRRAQA